ncbi:hypothetical protein RCL_jg1574.t1 [Rhizophagus clarus]|uniref:Uncharacterized protein n=1 Tax=Rhizophagus clarus TaxID=94130 RepID=A0A8H3L538_9GLOM|nr:hypothetical protein RCL_jg1574.t1 [Rhizophagus clarus]
MKKDENETKKRQKEKKMKVVSNEDEETINNKQKNNRNKAIHLPHFQRESANLKEMKNLGEPKSKTKKKLEQNLKIKEAKSSK